MAKQHPAVATAWEQSDSSDDERRNGIAEEEDASLSENDPASLDSAEDSDDDDDDDESGEEEEKLNPSGTTPAEGPGFAQFLDSDDEAAGEEPTSDEEEGDSEESGSEGSDARNGTKKGGRSVKRVDDEEAEIRQRMETLPFSALLKARRSLQASHSDDEDAEPDEFEDDRRAARVETERKERREIEKRENKHAPTEMSTRRPVSRRRQVVETPDAAAAERRRDPRFSSLSGSLPNKGVYQTSYGFLRTQQSDEITQLRQALAKLKRQEAHHAGPRATSEMALRVRDEREAVERALRREEGRENERRRREHEDEVVRRAKKSIEERVKQGGKQYHLKDSDKKKLVLEDKFAKLTDGAAGGSSGPAKRGGLQRALERRRKKNANKDRQMPLGGGGATAIGAGMGRKGATFADDTVPMPKRKKLQADGQRGGRGGYGKARGSST